MKIEFARAIMFSSVDIECWHDDKGEMLLDIAPHLAWVGTFAVVGPFAKYSISSWIVIHIETGYSAGAGNSKSAAVEDARQKLGRCDVDRFNALIRKLPKWARK